MDQTKKLKASLEDSLDWNYLIKQFHRSEEYDYPCVTVVVSTYNSAESIGFTLESVISQDYPDLEIIIVDASSQDRTMEIVKGFRDSISRIYTVMDYNIYEMMNRGISLANGEYVNFLFPGDFYLSQEALKHIMRVAGDNNAPDLIYCGCILRDFHDDPKVFLRPLNLDALKRGKLPASLESCWFKVESLKKIGKFNRKYSLLGGFDILCRLCKNKDMRFAMSYRILTDYDRCRSASAMLLLHSKETFKIIFHHFGWLSAIKWWLLQSHFHFIKYSFKGLKKIFLGR